MVVVFRSWLASVRTTNLSVADVMWCSIQRFRSCRQISLGSIGGGAPVCPGMAVARHDIVGSRLIRDVHVSLFQGRVGTTGQVKSRGVKELSPCQVLGGPG